MTESSTAATAAFALARPVTRSVTFKRRSFPPPQNTSHKRARAAKLTFATASSPQPSELLQDLQRRMQAASDPKYQKWISAYMRNEIPCRGVKLPSIKAVAAEWASANALSGAVHGIDDRDLARSLFMAEYQEDKLAGMFYVHEVLQKKGLVGLDWLDLFEQMYDQGYLYTWNTVDLFCIRVVRKMVEDFGDQAVAAISDWRFADNVWRARSSVVGLLCLSKKTEYRDIIWENCRVLICREERFAKTAVGWMMREIARWDEPHVKQFLEHFKKDMSLEATRNAAKHFSAAEKKKYVAMVKAAQRASDST